MKGLLLRVSLLATLTALPEVASAQFPAPPPPPGGPTAVQNRWPESPPKKPAEPAQPQQQQQQQETPQESAAAPKPKSEAKPVAVAAAPSTAVTCGGLFAKDTTHLKLAQKYDSRNLAYDDVDGPDGAKIKATILFPRDPRRRLEILWNNDTARTDVQVISINGKSQWSAPRGLKLGLPLAALEKANGKPFKISGFGPDGTASVDGWEGGAMSKLPGGCKVGVRLTLSPPDTAAGDSKEMLSNDTSLKALKPTIGEILIGY